MRAPTTQPHSRGSLTGTLIRELSNRLDRQIYRAGERMPSEHELCKEFGVSRTVVREAVASLRLAGRLVSKPGVGVFVVPPPASTVSLPHVSTADGRAALHVLELRIGLEVEAAGLAAERRTPQDMADIVAAYDACNTITDARRAAEADYAFHLAIARASNNPHFPQLLQSSIRDVMLDLNVKRTGRPDAELAAYEKRTAREHDTIVTAIMRGDAGAARAAMFKHLNDSVERYRMRVRRQDTEQAPA
ncbi:FadR/GntR family transcriptional regulator [Paracandidimonas lactea]|uniref:FadR/GntR family transcriptional regulator n=1 Tax=Paracandidimonas lactea TaxID=2895524 RepID=UPI001F17E7CD